MSAIVQLIRPEGITAFMMERKEVEASISRLNDEYARAAEEFHQRCLNISRLQKLEASKIEVLDEAIFKLLYKKIDTVS